MNDIEWSVLELPNLPIYRTKLTKKITKLLWKKIDIAKVQRRNMSDALAGNISSSLALEEDVTFSSTVLYPICKHIIDSNIDTLGPELHPSAPDVSLDIEWWVNFQKQLEFNPQHNHAGILSFVIWMQIPTDWREQHTIPSAKVSNSPAASDFQFTYTDIVGNIKAHPIYMDKSMEGTMVVFPAHLSHSVYPFYDCDEERISIAGNVHWNIS